MSSSLVFHRVYKLEIRVQSVMLVFSTPLVNCCPSTYRTDSVWLWGGGALSRVVDHILQEFNTLFLTRLEPTKLLHHPKQKHQ
jgi:hypothetical protein